MEEQGGGGEEQGVLLYYRYVTIPDVPSMALFFRANCESLGLLGRVRISPSGVNVTVGGKMTSLKQHISALESHSLFEGTDFKLASCRRPSDDRVATECGFTTLSVRVVKELVTLCSHPLPRPLSISNAGEHLSAAEFHSVIQNAGTKDSKFYKGHVLLDARNIYETRIGKFQAADIDTLDPGIRQYSDLPAWIDAHSDKLQGNCILMYSCLVHLHSFIILFLFCSNKLEFVNVLLKGPLLSSNIMFFAFPFGLSANLFLSCKTLNFSFRLSAKTIKVKILQEKLVVPLMAKNF